MTATFSADRRYRYLLERPIAPMFSRTMLVCMLNPSTADESADDPTIRRLVGFAGRLDVGHLLVVNLAAKISTDPRGLRLDGDAIGERNDATIEAARARSQLLVVAWGAGIAHLQHGEHRAAHVLELLRARSVTGGDGREVWCWGRTKNGHPRHPLMLPSLTDLVLYG